MQEILEREDVKTLVGLALAEDLGAEGDVTGRIVNESAVARGDIVARAEGVVCGLPLGAAVLARVEPRARMEILAKEGARVERGATVARVQGPARGVLAAERTLLNFVQRLSGIATATRRFVDAIAGTGARIYDTRKTQPGWRALAKYAVRAGGGTNHRMGLHDQVLVKDNHLALFGGESGGIPHAIEAARAAAPPRMRIEIEVTTLEGALLAAEHGADIVLLDNMTPSMLARVVSAVREAARERRRDPPELEASGGVTLENVFAFAASGVDRVSVGWITHSAPALDLALDLDIDQKAPARGSPPP